MHWVFISKTPGLKHFIRLSGHPKFSIYPAKIENITLLTMLILSNAWPFIMGRGSPRMDVAWGTSWSAHQLVWISGQMSGDEAHETTILRSKYMI